MGASLAAPPLPGLAMADLQRNAGTEDDILHLRDLRVQQAAGGGARASLPQRLTAFVRQPPLT